MRSTRLTGMNCTDIPDRDLIQAALEGNQSGYEQLVKRYQDRLFRSILMNVGYADVAEDITQEAFVQGYLHLDTFQNRSSFYTWLYRIAMNLRRKYLRHRHQTLSFEPESNDRNQSWVPSDSSPQQRLERKEEQIEVRCALARLDDVHRTILILREFEGFDYQKIAEIMHVELGTVRSRLHRARAKLRKELSGYVLCHSSGFSAASDRSPSC